MAELVNYRRNNPRFQGESFQKNLQLVDKVNALAQRKGATASQLALAWVLARGRDIVPIPGTQRVKSLEENVAAATVQLSTEEFQQLDPLAPKGVAAGTRYPEAGMKAVHLWTPP